MAYINIKEYDNTIAASQLNTGDIVVVPINSNDGPSDKWITVNSYNEFIQLFGPKPTSKNSTKGNSWEYAANLLMRNMPVCVRRITHELLENGNNSNVLLPEVTTAKGIIKVKDAVGTNITNSSSLEDTPIDVQDTNLLSKLSKSKQGKPYANPAYLKYSDKDTTFPSIWELEQTTLNNDNINYYIGKFADVKDSGKSYPFVSSNNEWKYSGRVTNPKCKNKVDESGDVVPAIFDDVLKNDATNASFGDFYLIEEKQDDGTSKLVRVDFEENGIKNNNYISTDSKSFSFNALLEKSKDNINKNSFVTLSYDKLGNKVNNRAWEYTNCNFFNSKDELNNSDKKDYDYILIKNATIDNIFDVYSIGDNYTQCQYSLTFALDEKDAESFIANNKEKLDKGNLTNDLYVMYSNNELYKITKKSTSYIIESANTTISYLTVVKNDRYKITTATNITDIKGDYAEGDFVQIDEMFYVYTSDNDWTGAEAPSTNFQTINVNPDEPFPCHKYIVLPWTDTNHTLNDNTSLYKEYFYWKIATGDDKYNYLMYTHWTKTEKSINTTIHELENDSTININDIKITAFANTNATTLKVNVNNSTNDDIVINDDVTDNRLTAGKILFINKSDNPIRIYQLKLTKQIDTNNYNVLYDSNIEIINVKNNSIKPDTYLQIKTIDNKNIDVKCYKDSNDRNYFELPAGASITYNDILTGLQLTMQVAFFDDANLTYQAFKSVDGSYDINLSNTKIVNVRKHALPGTNTEKEIAAELKNINDLPIYDGRGNFNLFIAEYLYPGSNGNSLKLSVNTIKNQGIYIYVYREDQYIERLELCTFRNRLDNGKIQIFDLEHNIDDIWRNILLKFGIRLDVSDVNALQVNSLYGNNVKIDLNPKLTDYATNYDYVRSLYDQNGSKDQMTRLSGGNDPIDDHVIHEVSKCYKPLEDKYKYDITFVSNGGYVDDLVYSTDIVSANNDNVRSIEDAMLQLVTSRQDCIAYLDAPMDITVEDVPTYFEHISTSYAAAYDPWCQIVLATGGTKWMPPSFIQLYTHAKSISNGNKMYLPPAGVRRALVPEVVSTMHDLPSSYLTDWQTTGCSQFINPIIWINGYDYSIFGQKTLYNLVSQSNSHESTLQNLNVRLVANKIKKLVFNTCINLTFEHNSIITWNEFKSKIEPTLSTMQGEGVLSDYEVLMGTETMSSADLNSGHINGIVRVAIANAVTDWDINFEIQPNKVTFYENDYNSTYSI